MIPAQPLPATVLYLDSNAAARRVFTATFGTVFTLRTAESAQEAWNILGQGGVHVLIAAQGVPEMKGAAFLYLVRRTCPSVHRMLAMDHADPQVIIDALNRGGVCHFISQPWDIEEVRDAVATAFARCQAEQDRAAFTERLVESNRQLEFALRQHLLS